MKKNPFYAIVSKAFFCFSLSYLLVSCTIERDPEITNLSVCDTNFTVHNGCDNSHSSIATTAPFITAAFTADNLEETNAYEFNIYIDIDGTSTFLATSGSALISTTLDGEEINDSGQVLGFSWESQPGQDWLIGSYTMEVKIDTDPELVSTVNYIVE